MLSDVRKAEFIFTHNFFPVNVENRRKHQVREQSAVWGCRTNLISGAAACDDDDDDGYRR